MNHDIMKKKSDPKHEPWEVVGGFHSPAELAKINKSKTFFMNHFVLILFLSLYN